MLNRKHIKHQAMLEPEVAKEPEPKVRGCERGGNCEYYTFNGVKKCIKCNKVED